ncbi:hypothetical protein HPB50_002894 [Hyalomma asiaticum]|uniref:Uncharacterized protein n=1 Tax=Hyalomma asiaticum TaxID=266040 RepID=A0ACB7TDK1_HYAAI|nr:hypothetical protein HPB50_002894 [Hyalomma asiaticum]
MITIVITDTVGVASCPKSAMFVRVSTLNSFDALTADLELKATGAEARGTTPNQQLLSSNLWDLISFEDEEPTDESMRRVRCSMREVELYRVPGVFISAGENNAAKIRALILRPPGTTYEGGFFYFLPKWPPDYTNCPPRVRVIATSAGRVRFGPNLCENGEVWLGIPGTSHGPAWSASQCQRSVLWSIKLLLSTKNSVAPKGPL